MTPSNVACPIFLLVLVATLTSASQLTPNSNSNSMADSEEKQDPKVNSVACKLCGEPPTQYFEQNSLGEKFDGQVTFDEYIKYAMRSLNSIAGFDNDLHRYDNNWDLINSFERNLSYSDDLTLKLRARIDASELELLEHQSELTVIENERNQENCARQLSYLIEETRKLMSSASSYSQSKQLSLIDYIDSFGSVPIPLLMMGNTMSLGSQQQCTQSTHKMSTGGGEQMSEFRSRYCIANFRSPDWQLELGDNPKRMGNKSIKLGVCLPRSCNSISMLRHADKIDKLIKLAKMNEIPYSGYRLNHLFCLPDETSPLRQLSLSAKLFVATLSCWLTLVFYYSIKYEFLLLKIRDDSQNTNSRTSMNSKPMRIFAFRLSWEKLFDIKSDRSFPVAPFSVDADGGRINLHAEPVKVAATVSSKRTESESGIDSSDTESIESIKTMQTSGAVNELGNLRCNLAASLAFSDNTGEPKNNTIDQLHHRHRLAGNSSPLFKCDSPTRRDKSRNAQASSRRAATSRETTTTTKAPTIDLAAIDGVKVLSMIWLISAHTLLFFIRSISNGRDFWSILRDARFITIMMGIFPVDSFFTITGILTAYLKFNKNDGVAMRKVSYWIEAFVHRYLRFMPMYLLVFWYTRDVSEYIGSGPLWDYATADTSLRSVCKQESALVPLLFQANFKPIDQHCVKPAWYLANDYQYLMMTPIFVSLMMKSRTLGYLAIGFSVAASLVAQFLTVFYSNEFNDFDALVNFKPMFATYVLKDLWRLYVLPYNRVPPYLIGLLTGHLMYICNKESIGKRQRVPDKGITQPVGGLKQSKSDQSIASSTSSQLADRLDASTSNLMSDWSLDQMSGKIASNLDSLQSLSKQKQQQFIVLIQRFVCANVWTPLIVLISIIYLPLMTKLTTLADGLQAQIGASSIIALMRFAWSMAIARLIYICATRFMRKGPVSPNNCNHNQVAHCAIASAKSKVEPDISFTGKVDLKILSHHQQPNGDHPKQTTRCQSPKLDSIYMGDDDSFAVKFLSSPKWKPWSKIGLSALLIQWEVISYFAQTQTSLPVMTISILMAFILVCIVATYSLALLIYLTIEYPLSQVEQLYIHPVLFDKASSS